MCPSRLEGFVIDAFGAYPVPADSIFARAPKTKTGRFKLNTKLGKLAQAEFLRNQDRRTKESRNAP